MRKLFSVLIVLALLASAIPAWAGHPDDLKYTIINTTGTTQVTAISTNIIKPGIHRILKFDVCSAPPLSAVTETVAALYDAAAATGVHTGWLEGEIEGAGSSPATVEKKYIRPLNLKNGAVIMQGAWTIVSIEYEKVIP